MKILIADPERDFLTSYRKLSEYAGHEVLTAFDGVQALALIREAGIDAAALGDKLPRVPLSEILSEAKEHGVPVMLLRTSEAEPIRTTEAILNFPFSFDAFLETAERLGKEKNV